MRKHSISQKEHASGEAAPELRVQAPLTGDSSAIVHRIRALRAEARAVYAEMAAAVLVNKREKP